MGRLAGSFSTELGNRGRLAPGASRETEMQRLDGLTERFQWEGIPYYS